VWNAGAVHGTPADCGTVAVRQLMKEQPPQLLLSGINNGSNIGFETVLSGILNSPH
jgi:5'-nucleotidase